MPSNPGSDFERDLAKMANFIARVGKRIEGFWQRVTEGITVQVLWAQFMAEARDSYSLYTREIDWEALRKESRGRRFRKTTSALFWAMVMKLSPARRVFLLIALFLAIVALTSTEVMISTSEHRYEVGLPHNFLPVFLASPLCFFCWRWNSLTASP